MHFGYLSDPYKEVKLVGAVNDLLGDFRPNMRSSSLGLLEPAPRGDRGDDPHELPYYRDTWGISSHQFELSWYQTFGDSLQITPTVRYYSQTGSNFYVPYLKIRKGHDYEPPDNFSSDYRLSAYGSLSFGAKAEYAFHTPWLRDIEWRGRVSVERYLSSGDLSMTSVSVPAPGLVSFTVFSLGLSVVF
jgi:hypothetical protein